ncbi:MAG: DNA-binding domain-containing protein [Cryomorphaceae bacterium]
MPRLRDDTHRQQSMLATYTRDGVEPDLQGLTSGRLHHYRRLVFNVVCEALSSTYPLTVNLLTQKEWGIVCHDFFEEHDCAHPQVWRMPKELIAFIEENKKDLIKKYPHLMDLLELEWLEAEYYMMNDKPFKEGISADPISEAWHLNPESEILGFDFPVHLKNARFISNTDRGQYFCLIHRQASTGKVKFMNLSPFLAWFIGTLKTDETITPSDLFPVISQQFGMSDTSLLSDQLKQFYTKLKSVEMVN